MSDTVTITLDLDRKWLEMELRVAEAHGHYPVFSVGKDTVRAALDAPSEHSHVPSGPVRKPFEEGFAPDTTMDSLHRPRGNRVECDGCEQCRECVSVGEEVLCAGCILARTVDHAAEQIPSVLGDEDREQLTKLANWCGHRAAEHAGTQTGDVWLSDEALLRKLAEHPSSSGEAGLREKLMADEMVDAVANELFNPIFNGTIRQRLNRNLTAYREIARIALRVAAKRLTEKAPSGDQEGDGR